MNHRLFEDDYGLTSITIKITRAISNFTIENSKAAD